MHKIYLYKAGLLIYSLGMIALGVVILCQGELVFQIAAYFGALIMAIHGVHLHINFFFGKKDKARYRRNSTLIIGTMNILGGIGIALLPYVTEYLLVFVFAVYVYINAITKFIDYNNYRKNDVPGRIYDLFAFLFYLTFGTITLFLPQMGKQGFLIVSGIYCVLYGASQLYDFLIQIIPQKALTSFKRRIRIRMPVFVSTFMPLKFLHDFNKFVAADPALYDKKPNDTPLNVPVMEVKDKDGSPPDLEVLIHISNDSVGKMGHCDICFDDMVVSYGNYDGDSQSMFGALGDGVMFTAVKMRYIRFSVTHDKKIIMCYGIRLTKEQREAVINEFNRMKETAFDWKCDYNVALDENPEAHSRDYKDYGSKLWDGIRCNYYKFRSGMFKTYFLLSTNCVLLADHLLGQAGTDVVRINGIITPGSYFDFLERELLVDGSSVISKTIYTKDNTEEWNCLFDDMHEEDKGYLYGEIAPHVPRVKKTDRKPKRH